MSAFIDGFYNDNLFGQNKIKSMLNSMPNLQEDYGHFIIHFKDLERNENLQIELEELKGIIPNCCVYAKIVINL